MNKKNRIIIVIGIAIVIISTFSFYAFFQNKPEKENTPIASEEVEKPNEGNGNTEYISGFGQDSSAVENLDTEKSYMLPEDAVKPAEWDETEEEYTALQEGFYLEGFPEEMLPFINEDLEGLQNSIQTVLYDNGYYDYHSASFGQNITFDYDDQNILFSVIAHANENVNLGVTYSRNGGIWKVEPY